MKHPHVVEILDVARDEGGVPYLVMELLEGESLSDVLRRDGPLPWSRVSPILAQLADALACAHSHGVVHRDVKPSNIIVRNAGTPDEKVTLIDFGLAKHHTLDRETRDITHTGDVFGSPGYMSPEQLRSETVDARADVYALGCVAFELLVGRKPFPGPSVADLVVQHLTQEPPCPEPIDAAPNEVPAIQALILRALHKDPSQRQPGVTELAREVAQVGQASGPTRPGPSASPPRRRWLGLLGGSALLVGLGLALSSTRPPPLNPAEPDAPPASRGMERPIDGPTPPWPTRWLGAELGQPQPQRNPSPSRTDASIPYDMVGVWGAGPRLTEPYRLLASRADAMALSERAVARGLTLGHPVDDPLRVELEGRGGDPSTGRVYWSEPRGFPLRAVGTTQIGPGCVGIQVGPVHVLTSAQCVWAEGGFAFEDRRWQPGDERGHEEASVPFVRVYVPQPWPQNDRSGLFDWAVAITERQIGDEYFGVTALADEALVRTALHHKGYPLEHDRECDARSPRGWALGADRPWGNPEPLRVTLAALRAPSPVSGWARVMGMTQPTSSGHAGGPYYFYDESKRPVIVALHRSACTDADGGSPEFCGFTAPWRCGGEATLVSQAIRLEPDGLYGHIVPILTWWGVDESGRAVCLLDDGC